MVVGGQHADLASSPSTRSGTVLVQSGRADVHWGRMADSALQGLGTDDIRVPEPRDPTGHADESAEEVPRRATSPAQFGDGGPQLGVAELALVVHALREHGDFREVHDLLLTFLGTAEVLWRTVGKQPIRRYWGIH